MDHELKKHNKTMATTTNPNQKFWIWVTRDGIWVFFFCVIKLSAGWRCKNDWCFPIELALRPRWSFARYNWFVWMLKLNQCTQWYWFYIALTLSEKKVMKSVKGYNFANQGSCGNCEHFTQRCAWNLCN